MKDGMYPRRKVLSVVRNLLNTIGAEQDNVTVCGALRRGASEVESITLVVAKEGANDIATHLGAMQIRGEIHMTSEWNSPLRLFQYESIPVAVHVTHINDYGYAVWRETAMPEELEAMRQMMGNNGIIPHGNRWKHDGHWIVFRYEDEFRRFIGLSPREGNARRGAQTLVFDPAWRPQTEKLTLIRAEEVPQQLSMF